LKRAIVLGVLLCLLAHPASAINLLKGKGASAAAAAPAGFVAPLTIYNSSGSTLPSGTLVTYEQPFATGDVSSSNTVQIRLNNGVTQVSTVQQDDCSLWKQDSSHKACPISFQIPASISGNGNYVFQVWSEPGSANNSANVTKANITANTNFVIKTTALYEATTTQETGTWDFIDLNYVLNNCTQFNGSTGYGSNPHCGWEFDRSGPAFLDVHAWMFAKRESDNAIHNWLRTDIWVGFPGSGATPCTSPDGVHGCSIFALTTIPNTQAAISGGTVGGSTPQAYQFAYSIYNGANDLVDIGGPTDPRASVVGPSAFNTTNLYTTINGYGSLYYLTPVGGSTLPAGLTSGPQGSTFWTYMSNGATTSPMFATQCGTTTACQSGPYSFVANGTSAAHAMPTPIAADYLTIFNSDSQTLYYNLCPTSSCTATGASPSLASNATVDVLMSTNTYVAYYQPGNTGGATYFNHVRGFTTTGTGTFNVIPLAFVNPVGALATAASDGGRYWTNTTATALAAAPTYLVGHDFTYLTQKSKATPPYITNLAGTLDAYPSSNADANLTYASNAYPWDTNMNSTGAAEGDPRIGPIDHIGAYSLFMPADKNAFNSSRALATGMMREHMWQFNDATGLPMVVNNGPDRAGATYPTLGTDYPTTRSYPYIGGSGYLLSPGTTDWDNDFIYEAYGEWMDPSHMQAPWQVPLLKTGLPEFEFMGISQAQAVSANLLWNCNTPAATYLCRAQGGGSTVFGSAGTNQPRGTAWAMRILSQANYFLPNSSTLTPYFQMLVADNAQWMVDFVANWATPAQASLGYFWADTYGTDSGGTDNYQPWQDDYIGWIWSWEAWRGEYPNFANWVNNYWGKQFIGRMDASAGTPGCLWGAAARHFFPWGLWNITGTYNSGTGVVTVTTNVPNGVETANSAKADIYNLTGTGANLGNLVGTWTVLSRISNTQFTLQGPSGQGSITISGGNSRIHPSPYYLPTNWVDEFYNSSSSDYNQGNVSYITPNLPPGTSSPASTCPTSGFITDNGPGNVQGSNPSVGSLVSDTAVSAAMASLIGYADTTSIYNTIRTQQYSTSGCVLCTPALSFQTWTPAGGGSAGSFPEMAIGPLGATQLAPINDNDFMDAPLQGKLLLRARP
jgi:hypothetical protein